MFLGDFFDIQSFTFDDTDAAQQKYHVVVLLNVNHPIYQGHFPGNPVVPGVCQIQMVKELVEKVVRQPLNLRESDNIKFLSMINPVLNPQLEFTIVVKPIIDQLYAATVTIGFESSVFLKFKGKFEPAG
jgi:3-hydroxyacyl-[acyl-carrier-protein] dehydratase